MFDEAIQKVRDAGYSVCYSNDCQYPCLLVRLFNDEKQRERMVDHTLLSDEDNVANIILEMLEELETGLQVVEVNPSFAKAVEENDGYCPCSVFKDEDTKCPCKDFREQNEPGVCYCGRYEKVVI